MTKPVTRSGKSQLVWEREERLRPTVRINYSDNDYLDEDFGPSAPPPLNANQFQHYIVVKGKELKIVRYFKPLERQLSNRVSDLYLRSELEDNRTLKQTYTPLRYILRDRDSAEATMVWIDNNKDKFTADEFERILEIRNECSVKLVKNTEPGDIILVTKPTDLEMREMAFLGRITKVVPETHMWPWEWSDPSFGAVDYELIVFDSRRNVFKPYRNRRGIRIKTERLGFTTIADESVLTTEQQIAFGTVEKAYNEMERRIYKREYKRTVNRLNNNYALSDLNCNIIVADKGGDIYSKLRMEKWGKTTMPRIITAAEETFTHTWIPYFTNKCGQLKQSSDGRYLLTQTQAELVFSLESITRLSLHQNYLFFAEGVNIESRDSKIFIRFCVSLCTRSGVIVSSMPAELQRLYES